MSYRVELPVFSGPMDLLLHLVRQQEVDIHEVRIAAVLDQYLAHVDVLEALDLGDVGDFVVMASTLMEIKSKELLPREEVDLEQELSPKDDLIRRLLEYKRYRDISRRLAGMMERRGKMIEPVLAMPKHRQNGEENGKSFDLGTIEIWDLTEAFAKLLEETGASKEMKFDVSRRNVDYYAEQILTRVRGKGDIDFFDLFDVSKGRYEVIGVFGAMLEMMKQGYLRGHQDDETGAIRLHYVGPEDVTVDEVLRGTGEAYVPDEDRVEVEADPETETVAEAEGGTGTGTETGDESATDPGEPSAASPRGVEPLSIEVEADEGGFGESDQSSLVRRGEQSTE